MNMLKQPFLTNILQITFSLAANIIITIILNITNW